MGTWAFNCVAESVSLISLRLCKDLPVPEALFPVNLQRTEFEDLHYRNVRELITDHGDNHLFTERGQLKKI